VRSIKIYFLVYLTLILITDKHKLNVFIIVIVCALAFYGVKGGIFTLATGGNYRVWGPGGFVEGNNELAVALMMTLPMVRYLYLQAQSKWARRLALATLCLMPVTILGSHSRGALLALCAGGLLLWLRAEKKMLGAGLIVVAAVAAVVLMPAAYWSRMETIETYNQDTSAMTRINAWWCAFNVAKTHFFGGGFDYYTWDVIGRYAPDPTSLQGPHSIYFQIMGEHGFVGLFIFLGIGATTWLTCAKMRREARGRPDLKWVGDLGSMIQVSMIGFAVGGAFLGLAYFDLPYYLMVAAVVGLHVARRQPAPAAAAAVAAPPAPALRRALSR